MLDGFQFHQMVATPRPAAEQGRSSEKETDEKIRAQLFAAVCAAHGSLGRERQGAFALAWDRTSAGRGLRILIGGRPGLPMVQPDPNMDGLFPVLYPPGSLGKPLDTGDVLRDWQELVWLRCKARPDALWNDGEDSPENGPVRGGFEDYVAHLPGAFAWLVVAEPLAAEDLDNELADLEVSLSAQRSRPNWEPDRIAIARGEARYRELSRALPTGIWNLHVLVGGPDLTAARQAAGLLCSASDLDELPYTLLPAGGGLTLAQAWLMRNPVDASGFASPFAATAELVAALARPPRRELPGIRIVEPAVFDVTPERAGDVPIGQVLDETGQKVAEFAVTTDTLNRHTFVAGATGSGKSQTTRNLLEGLTGQNIKWLVIEPAKAEYARMAGRISEPVTVIRPGDVENIPVGLNPLEPEAGFPLQTHIDLVRALFLAAFDAEEPFPQVLAQALSECYTGLGWDITLGESRLPGIQPRYPSLSDVQQAAMRVVEGIGYGKEITDNVRGFIDVRLGSLRLGTPGRFFEGGFPIDIADMLNRNVVLEIEDVGNDTDKAFFIGAVMIRIFEHLRTRQVNNPVKGLQHVTIIEEAHRLLKRADEGSPAAHAVELFASLLAEIRAYGEGIVVAEQIPAKITPDVVKNTALKIIHRLPAEEDRETVGAAMNLDEKQSRQVVSLLPGQAAVFADGMDRPIRVQVPYGEDRESTENVSHEILFTSMPYSQSLILRDIARAQRVAEDHRLVLWIELLVMAHLTGRQAPLPAPGWLDSLNTMGTQSVVLEAVTSRIRGAIDARYVGLTKYYQPEALANHLLEVAIGLLDRILPPCEQLNETGWQAGAYRWADVETALAESDVDMSVPHPETSAWAERGLFLSGPAQKQLETLRFHPDVRSDDKNIIYGAVEPSPFKTAINKLSANPDAVQRFLEASNHLYLKTLWPLALVDGVQIPEPPAEDEAPAHVADEPVAEPAEGE